MRGLSEIGRRAAQWTKTFLRAKEGNAAMMFGLSAITILTAAGGALDWSRAMEMKTRLGAALDAAALAIGTTSGLSQPQLQAKAQQYFDANYPAGTLGTPGPVQVVVEGQAISLSVAASMPTTLLRLAHIDQMDLAVNNQIVRAVTKLRVALVLDNTGSMCQPDSSPCPSPSANTKITALKTATHQLLTILQNAAINPGDVQVAIIPFSLDVKPGTAAVNAAWVDWTDWEAAPPNSMPASTVGWGSACPYGTGTNPYGYRCTQNPTNGSSSTGTVPSSGAYKGYIIPGKDNGAYNPGRGGHYYNGYYDSVATQTSTTTNTGTTPVTIKQNCSQTGTGPITCNNKSGYPSYGSTANSPVTVVTDGYSGDSGPTVTSDTYATNSTSDGSKTCSGPVGNKTCTWTRTISQTETKVTVTAIAANFTHTWYHNDHSTWTGCIMDREQDYDTTVTTPSGGSTNFPAENNTSCPVSSVTPLSFNWSDLSDAVDAMQPNGSTNQTIGFSWGWQALTEGDPLNAPASDNLTSQVIILLSDGLNTQNRWHGDGSTTDPTVDARETLACDHAKAAGVIVYTLFVDIGGTSGNSAPLQNCASDAGKYSDLTAAGDIVTAFNQIGTELANLHLSQ